MRAVDQQAPVYPWQEQHWSRLTADFTHLPHAILIRGSAGMGKNAFARRAAWSFLCAQPGPGGYGCGKCQSCRLFVAGSHPDFLRVEPEEEGKTIAVDQMRALGECLALHPHTAERKVVIISPAENMNINASNSLLKLLEEPPGNCIIMLVSARPDSLAATIRSRCQRLEMRPPDRGLALKWLRDQDIPAGHESLLELSAGAPLLALELGRLDYLVVREQLIADMENLATRGSEGPVACAARWEKTGLGVCLDFLQGFTADLVRLAMAGKLPERLYAPAKQARLQALVERLNLKELFAFLAAISEARKLSSGPLDKSLLLEDILIRWYRLTHSSRKSQSSR